MEGNEWLTKDVAEILDVSIPTVRNYAKTLERYNHEFSMRKTARIWTDTEINIIREATELFKNSEYPLEMCFQYAIAKRNVGEDKAKELLKAPVQHHSQQGQNDPTPQLQQLTVDVSTILEGINDIKEGLTPDNGLLEHQDKEKGYISEIEQLKAENSQLSEKLKEYSDISEQMAEIEKELKHVQSLGMLQFRKWKQER